MFSPHLATFTSSREHIPKKQQEQFTRRTRRCDVPERSRTLPLTFARSIHL